MPWLLWNGLIKVPYVYEDDAAVIYRNNTQIAELIIVIFLCKIMCDVTVPEYK